VRCVAALVILVSLLSAQNASELNGYITLLGSDVPLPKKQEAARKLVQAGKAAIPLLIAALRDQRIYEQRDMANRMNLPGTAPPPKPRWVKVLVSDRSRQLLYEIITPVGSSFDGKFKVYSEQKLQVDDWDAWWAANQHKSIAKIHAELTPLVDEYWKRHGTTQNTGQAGEPAEWEGDIPIPKGARADAAGGTATSLGPGANYRQKRYDIAADVDAMSAFYARYLPGAKRTSGEQGVTFSKRGSTIRLTRKGQGTRIIVSFGPG